MAEDTETSDRMLDTQALLWLFTEDDHLSANARHEISKAGIVLTTSHVSVWEIAIKHAKGKLPLPDAPEPYLAKQLAANRIRLLPISLASIYLAGRLPRHHGDPFDRLLVAQCLRAEVPLISSDKQLDAYDIRRIW